MGNRGDLLGNSTNQEEDTEDSRRRHVGARPSTGSHLRQREQPFGHRRMETSLSYPILHPHHRMGSVIAPAAAQYHTKSSKNLIPCNIHTKSYPILKPNINRYQLTPPVLAWVLTRNYQADQSHLFRPSRIDWIERSHWTI